MNLKNLNHIPVPRAFREHIRMQTFRRLLRAAFVKGEQEKAKREGLADGARLELSESEIDEIVENLRGELKRRGFFDL